MSTGITSSRHHPGPNCVGFLHSVVEPPRGSKPFTSTTRADGRLKRLDAPPRLAARINRAPAQRATTGRGAEWARATLEGSRRRAPLAVRPSTTSVRREDWRAYDSGHYWNDVMWRDPSSFTRVTCGSARRKGHRAVRASTLAHSKQVSSGLRKRQNVRCEGYSHQSTGRSALTLGAGSTGLRE